MAPISRTSIVIGKILGGATTATIQASLMLILTPLIGIKISFLTIIILFPAMFLIAFGMSSLGVLLASRMKSTESFPIVMQFIMMPMFFLSGALFPLRGVPTWLAGIAQFNPLTYGVNILRYIVFSGGDMPKEIIESFSTTILVKSLTPSISILIFLSFTLIVVSLSVISFNRIE